MEALNLALAPFDMFETDINLFSTGQAMMVVTPGSAVFEVVDPAVLSLTKKRMFDTGVGFDVICLGPPPVHQVPLAIIKQKGVPVNESVCNSAIFSSCIFLLGSQRKAHARRSQFRIDGRRYLFWGNGKP
eukprot:Rmarinus@m.7291